MPEIAPSLIEFDLKRWQEDFLIKIKQADYHQALGVYGYNLNFGLSSAILERHPATLALMGEEAVLGEIARQYVQEHLPSHPLMAEYGLNFYQYLADQPVMITHPFIKDLAKLESWITHSFHQPPVLRLTSIHEVKDWQEHDLFNYPFKLCPDVMLLSSTYPIVLLYQAWLKGETEAMRGLNIEAKHSPMEYICLKRPEFKVEIEVISLGVFKALEAIAQGEKFETALIAGLEAEAELSPDKLLLTLLNSSTLMHPKQKETYHESPNRPI